MEMEFLISMIVSFGIAGSISLLLRIIGYFLPKRNNNRVMSDEQDNREFQKKLAIAQIGATAGTALGSDPKITQQVIF